MAFNLLHLKIILVALSIVLAQDGQTLPNVISSSSVVQPKEDLSSFWTPDKMRAARFVLPIVDHLGLGQSESAPTSPKDAPIIMPPIGNGTSQDKTSGRTVRALQTSATTGRVFWSCSANYYYSCSASVIYSSSGNLIVTAGHCVFDTSTLTWYANCNWMFVPGYSNGNAPYGIWTAKTFYALTAYAQSTPNYNYDIGFVVLNQLNGYHIQQKVGSQSIGFNYPTGKITSDFGYPVNIGNGLTLQSCTGVPIQPGFTINNIKYNGQGLPNCGMGGGCSGGPWLQSYNSVSGKGVTYAVNSFTTTSYPNTIFGPVFDSTVYSVWQLVNTI